MAAAVLAAAAVLVIGFFVALEVRSVVAGPDAGAPAAAPTPVGHEWSQVEGHGTDGAGWWLGTIVNQALELRVNNIRALRLEPNATSPNLIGGYSGNSVTVGALGATVGGGGASGLTNRVTDNYGTVGGGGNNQAGYGGVTNNEPYATVGGGADNTAAGPYSTVGGGYQNLTGASATVGGGVSNDASGDSATIGGGADNTASGGGYSTVGGGHSNTASDREATVGGGESNAASADDATVGGGQSNAASGFYSTVPGGSSNTAAGNYSFAAGRRAKANHQGAFVWADSTDADFASSAADQFLVRASGGVSLNVTSGGLRLESNATSPNVIGGYSGNTVTTNVVGATISGGGYSANTNRVTDNYGTVGGGYNNQAGDNAGTTTDRTYATVGGGQNNTASGQMATVAGGYVNTASGYATTIAGGENNTASAPVATVGGGAGNAATAIDATVGGGYSNDASASYATVGGGYDNIASASYATVSGGWANAASGPYSTVGGGWDNIASASYATIAGGGRSDPGDPATRNRVTDNYGTVGGGGNNQAGDNAGTTTDRMYATVGGGYSNDASASYATVGGGWDNSASASYATVGGGQGNTASGNSATVGGGEWSTASGAVATVGGGQGNSASVFGATVSGGTSNAASASYATVGGGSNNSAAGDYSFAAGRQAKANHSGAFVWADSTNADFASERANQFRVRADGGARFDDGIYWVDIRDQFAHGTNIIIDTWSGAYLTRGGNWTNSSSRDQKENFTPVDGQAVLASLAEVPITTWNSKAEDPSIRHMGPVAQDFYAAFSLGASDTSIGTLDADGVALVAIQGLYALSQEQAARIGALEEENASLQQGLDGLDARVTALEGGAPLNHDSAGPLASIMPGGWLVLGALLVLGGLVLAQRRLAGGRS